MRLIKLEPGQAQEALRQAQQVLQAGGVIVYPTDTLYGLGADIKNKQDVQKIYQIKQRVDIPLSVLLPFKKSAAVYAQSSALAKQLIKQYWPGPLTLVLPKKKTVPGYISSNDYAGLRLIKGWANDLARSFGPITTTSANISGQPNLYCATDIYKVFLRRKYQPDLIIDAGCLKPNPGSTIVQISGSQSKILRLGLIKLKNL